MDKRVRRTRDRLSAALIALTLEEGYEAVSIRDITDRAGVGYATFFRHYRDKDALLANVLDGLIAELKEILQPGLAGDSVAEGTVIFEHVAANSTLYRVLISSQATHPVLQRIQLVTEQELLGQLSRTVPPAIPLGVVAHHLVTAIISLISWWLDNDRPLQPQRMGQIYSQLIIEPVISLLRARD
jgi:AcrR family transcriptional regulator